MKEDTAANQPINTRRYIWEADLSGTFQGAGGVGGLLLMEEVPATGTVTSHLYHYDGNGNVLGLTDASAALSAEYRYGPFGEGLRVTGLMAMTNPFRFSTHYTDEDTGLIYAKQRYYSETTGRWLSLDPINERGGDNFYTYVKNSPLNLVDPRRLIPCIEVPKSIRFSSGGKWAAVRQKLKPEFKGSGVQWIVGVDVTYEADVTIDCNCGCPNLRTVSGKRSAEESLDLNVTLQFGALSSNPIPYFAPPSPTTIAGGVGEIVAEGSERALT